LKKKDKNNILEFIYRTLKSYIEYSSFEKDNIMNEILKGIQNRYKLNNFPYNIECIDVSHLS
jgi:excinuclease UvrABC nuclease subunit